MSSTVEKIKERLSVADVISGYIKLDKAGSNFKARCPFHNEKTPSFFVSQSRGTYYCFGCGAKGDIFTFVQEFEGTDFMGAMRILANRAGVIIEKENPKEKGEKERLYKALEEASNFFEENLSKNKEALSYLSRRGLSSKTLNDWRLGFVPEEWRLLLNHLKSSGFKEDELHKAGLIKKGDSSAEKEGSFYDVFRGRIMFPIFDNSARIVGFSGRALVEEKNPPKYLNTSETPLFHKSEALYGIHKAKVAIRKKDYSLMVEGQMDLLVCHQAGFENAVATSGTAFTTGHLDKLRRLSIRILMAFDSDSAGFSAAKKSAELALLMGMEVKVAQLPKGSDPAELIKEDLEKWRKVLKDSQHIIDFYLDHLLLEISDKRAIAREVANKVLPYLVMLTSSIEQSHFVSQIAKKTGLREEAIWNDLKKTKAPSILGETDKLESKEEKKTKHRNHVERKIAGILFWQKGASESLISYDELIGALKSLAGPDYLELLLDSLNSEREELAFEAEVSYENGEKLRTDVEELLIHLENDLLRKNFVEKMSELQKAESEKDSKMVRSLLIECQKISEKMAELSKKQMVGKVGV